MRTKARLRSVMVIVLLSFITSSKLITRNSLNLARSSITAAALNNILTQEPSLKALDLSYCPDLLFDELDWSKQGELEFLGLLYGEKLIASQLQRLLHCLPKLTTLDICGCTALNLDTIDWSNQQKLTTLGLCGTTITEEGLIRLLQQCPHLEKVNLIGCKGLPEAYQLFFESTPALNTLRMKFQLLKKK